MKFHGTYSFILAAKLKALKGILKVWNKRSVRQSRELGRSRGDILETKV